MALMPLRLSLRQQCEAAPALCRTSEVDRDMGGTSHQIHHVVAIYQASLLC